MRKIIPISDLQRNSRQIVHDVVESNEPTIITQRGRAAAVLISADRFTRIEEDLTRLDELELLQLVDQGKKDFEEGRVLDHSEVRRRLSAKHSSLPKNRKRG